MINLEMAVRLARRGESFDMDRALAEILRGEKVTMVIEGTRRTGVIESVTNAGFRGQEAMVHFPTTGQRRAVWVGNLPEVVKANAIAKLPTVSITGK